MVPAEVSEDLLVPSQAPRSVSDRSATVADLSPGESAEVIAVGGARPFRRRLMELGLLPGTTVRMIQTAPLGDPIELEVRGCRLSVRRREARVVSIAR